MRFSAVPRFIEFAEQELMREAGLPYGTFCDQPAVWLPRRHLAIDYLSPARLDDSLTLVSWVSRMGDTSLTLRTDLRQDDGRVVAAATLVIVCVTATDFTKRTLPAEIREALRPFVWDADHPPHVADGLAGARDDGR